MPNDDFDKITIDHIQSQVNHETCTLDDIKHFNMLLLGIRSLHKKASRGNKKSYRLRFYFENLYRGLADVLEHSDLQAYENKAELVSDLI